VVPPIPFAISNVSTTKIKRNKWFTAKCRLSPSYNGFGRPVSYYLYAKVRGKWRLKRTPTAAQLTDGSWTCRVKLGKGQWRLRASFKDAVHPQQFSRFRSFTVK
jgi:hypothetical protein